MTYPQRCCMMEFMSVALLVLIESAQIANRNETRVKKGSWVALQKKRGKYIYLRDKRPVYTICTCQE